MEGLQALQCVAELGGSDSKVAYSPGLKQGAGPLNFHITMAKIPGQDDLIFISVYSCRGFSPILVGEAWLSSSV